MEFIGRSWEVVGVVEDVLHEGLDREPWPELYILYHHVPQERSPWLSSMSFAMVGTAELPTVIPTICSVLFDIDEALVIDKVAWLEERLYASIARPRLYGSLATMFAVAGLLLAAVGVGSVQAYWVVRRTREIGIRMAVGAGRVAILRMVLLNGCRLALVGTMFGILGAIATSRLLESMLFGVSPMDVTVMVGAVLVLNGVTFLACCYPAWRAATVEPMAALCCD